MNAESVNPDPIHRHDGHARSSTATTPDGPSTARVAADERAPRRVVHARAATSAALLLALPACQVATAVAPPGIAPNARLQVEFRAPIDLVVVQPGGAPDTLRAVQRLNARYQGASGDTIILRDIVYLDRRGAPRRASRGAELRYLRPLERTGRDGEVRALRFSPGRTLAAITLPVLVPVGLLVLLISL